MPGRSQAVCEDRAEECPAGNSEHSPCRLRCVHTHLHSGSPQPGPRLSSVPFTWCTGDLSILIMAVLNSRSDDSIRAESSPISKSRSDACSVSSNSFLSFSVSCNFLLKARHLALGKRTQYSFQGGFCSCISAPRFSVSGC